MSGTLLAVHVHVHVKPDNIDAFIAATRTNAEASLREPGVVRFDVMQEVEDPSRFVLVEVYRNPSGAAAHKETAHYLAWREAVAQMMAEPRDSVKHVNVFPEDHAY